MSADTSELKLFYDGDRLSGYMMGQQARALRKRLGLRLKHVAHHLGVSIPMVCQLEHGAKRWTEQRVMDYERACRLAAGKGD